MVNQIKFHMKELKCPKCGNIFTVDEADYASIVSQVRNAEFEEELARRLREMQGIQDARQKVKDAEVREDFGKKINEKEKAILEKEQEISRLKASLEGIQEKTRLEIEKAVSAKNLEIASLQSTIKINESEKEKAIMMVKSSKDLEIAELKNRNSLAQSKAEIQKTALKDEYEAKLKLAQEQVDYYKDLKIRMSTKMVGETLEAHCSNIFNGQMRPLFPNAYFEKDNDASGGSKGDFIFRDYDGDTEYISIMFEMKNEMDETATKHKNEDFFRKLAPEQAENVTVVNRRIG